MKVFIVEDEELAVERLEKILKEAAPDIEIMGHAESIRGSVSWLQGNPTPDLIFMDIELCDGQSFEIFNQTEIKSSVIFTTSYDEYALKAFKVSSIDYLLKPVKKEDMAAAISKYRQLKKQFTAPDQSLIIENLVQQLRQQQLKEYRSRFLVKTGQRLLSVEVKDIAYFYADDRITFFRTWDKAKHIVDYTIEELEQMLNPAEFCRVNRAFIIHPKSVEQIHTYFNGKLKLDLKPEPDKEVTISRERVQEFKDWMGR
ncbi:MAG: response regulator transcription factor [Sphingobacteriales bacterium]|nr:response regulator transcription factor [Sphingobacteriales bacterium]MBI3719469.1 response regulator transcription factor [Sphingobacteriales bacterium]